MHQLQRDFIIALLITVFALASAPAQTSPNVQDSKRATAALLMRKTAPKDVEEGFRLYHELAEAGDTRSMVIVANCYLRGIGVMKDGVQARKWYLKSSDNKDAQGMFGLGLCYLEGVGGDRDPKQAVVYFTKGSNAGSADAKASLGYCYHTASGVSRNSAMAAKLWSEASAAGNLVATMNLGYLYTSGVGVKKDEAHAFELYKKASDGGNAAAHNSVGLMLQSGVGVAANRTLAVEYFIKGANGGNRDAMTNLGIYYRERALAQDDEKSPDVHESFKYFKMAADLGAPRAMGYLGSCYQFGWDCKADEKTAISWAQKGANAGDARSMYYLGTMYFDRTYPEPRTPAEVKKVEAMRKSDQQKAAHWYLESAKKGERLGMSGIATALFFGKGVAKDETKAFDWLLKSAEGEGGLPPSMFSTGVCYLAGRGVAANRDKGMEWLIKAKAAGSLQAARVLAGIEQREKQVRQQNAGAALAFVALMAFAADGSLFSGSQDTKTISDAQFERAIIERNRAEREARDEQQRIENNYNQW